MFFGALFATMISVIAQILFKEVFYLDAFIENPTSVFALVGVLAIILYFVRLRKKSFSTQELIFCALMLACGIVLQQLRIFHMPQGGSVTLGAMVPLLLVAYRYGAATGALVGFLYGLLNLVQDPFILHPVQVLFDYPLPFMAMGIAGAFSSYYVGAAAAFAARFLCHFISGFVFFGQYAPEGMSAIYYSLIFNATYIVPELVITCIILRLLPLRRLLAATNSR